jgi:D-alanine-D-alanine ligase
VRIGFTFNVRSASAGGNGAGDEHWPDDAEEEFDSPETIEALAGALRGLGHEVELLGDGEPLLRRLLTGYRPDLVFNFAEGTGTSRSREARVPAVLEMLGIPYTGSDPLTLAATLDKECAKRLVRCAGVATPDWLVVDGDVEDFRDRLLTLPLPVIVKPAFEGSSKGIRSANLIEDSARIMETVEEIVAAYRQPVLVEEFIDGDELTVGVIGNHQREPFGIMRVLPVDRNGPFVYSLEVKRDWERLVRYECPAKLSPQDTRAVGLAALLVWKTLGCRDLARIDFRLRNHVPYFLEVNPLPGLNPKSSDLVLMARSLEISYSDLIGRILAAATERLSENPAALASY